MSATTFTCSLASGLLPVGNTDLFVVGAALATGPAEAPVVIAAAGLGDMLAKTALYAAGCGALRIPGRRIAGMVDRAVIRVNSRPRASTLAVLTSATTGLPPFYFFSIASGAMRMRLTQFIGIGLIGRMARFTALTVIAQAVKSSI